ncbi:hypothetical protein EDB86DRAFT_3076912 [Lactarius hatsudake]|nr:hypothetical protein EDB86DRAFT_3076912 [Lactarius hatsudake]
MLNSKSIPRVKTGSDGIVRPIAFLTSGDAFGIRLLLPPISPSSDYIADTVARFLIQPRNYKETCITRDVDVDSSAMSPGLTFSSQSNKRYSKFISGIYLGGIMRNTLFHDGPNMEVPGFVEKDPEKLISATLQAGDRARAPRLHAGRGFPARRSARRAPFCAVERVCHCDGRALDVLRQRAREGRVTSRGVGVCTGTILASRSTCGKALRILLGEEVEKRVETGLAKDGSGVDSAPQATMNKKL